MRLLQRGGRKPEGIPLKVRFFVYSLSGLAVFLTSLVLHVDLSWFWRNVGWARESAWIVRAAGGRMARAPGRP